MEEFIWYRIKRGETLNSIARKNGIDDIEREDGFTRSGWRILWEFNKNLIPNPNILIYVDEDEYADGWCINHKQGILRIPILNEQPEDSIDREFKKFLKEKASWVGKEPEVKDTPEQKEEWEEGFNRYWGCMFECGDYEKLIGDIKNLLSEREVFTKDELFMLKLATNDIHNKGNGAYDEIGEKIERMLSKLNKKK